MSTPFLIFFKIFFRYFFNKVACVLSNRYLTLAPLTPCPTPAPSHRRPHPLHLTQLLLYLLLFIIIFIILFIIVCFFCLFVCLVCRSLWPWSSLTLTNQSGLGFSNYPIFIFEKQKSSRYSLMKNIFTPQKHRMYLS